MGRVLIITLLLLGIVGVAFYFLKNKKVEKKTEKKEMSPEEIKEKIQNDNLKKHMDRLLVLNLKVRTDFEDLKIIKIVEETIDSIKKITDEMVKLENFSEASVMFNRIGEKYLPELIDGYLNLGEAKQKENKEEFVANLNKLSEEVKKIENSLFDENEKSFDRTNILIKSMFEDFEGRIK